MARGGALRQRDGAAGGGQGQPRGDRAAGRYARRSAVVHLPRPRRRLARQVVQPPGGDRPARLNAAIPRGRDRPRLPHPTPFPVEEAMKGLAATRPTAVNLFWALERMRAVAEAHRALPVPALRERLLAEAQVILDQDLAANKAMGAHGAALVPEGARILTHCNAGALATAGYGTALGVIRAAHERGRVALVWGGETRPVMQGSRLTAWEMVKEGIPHRLISDVAAGFVMKRGEVDLVVTGADRLAANGDTANKIGTYSLAVLARHHPIPFYVAAPRPTNHPPIPTAHSPVIHEDHPA